MISERVRQEYELYPDFTAELEAIEESGITPELLDKIIQKHMPNAEYNKSLYKRYEGLYSEVPIYNRSPRFEDESDGEKGIINNRIANDFVGEITDFSTGYFAGSPIAYSYSSSEESEEDTAGIFSKIIGGLNKKKAELALKEAKKALSDFVARNNMFDVDMETTKYATIYGYAGRLFYHDPKDGAERVMPIHGYETIILSRTNISEPQYAIRYFKTKDINNVEYWKVEFYDDSTVRRYKGAAISALELVSEEPTLYGYCPLQGIPRNNELMGDAEKVLSLIDDYDRKMSDSSNHIEGEVNSKTVYENINVSDEEIRKSNVTGAIKFFNPTGNGKVYKLNNSVNDTHIEHHLERLKENIYRFSKTANLSDDTFGTASGVALKFKLTGTETKCGMFQAKMITAGVYMFKLLGYCFNARRIAFDPLQCVMEFKRNFPLDILNEAQAAQALIAAGVPEEVAYQIALKCIDDIDYVMGIKEAEKNDIPSLYDTIEEDEEEAEEAEEGDNPADKIKEEEQQQE
jgi:SPP1 family phage portal protein